jgi:hypothetical protein
MDLPLFELQISDDESSALEVNYVALVEKPAIEKNFLSFGDQRLSFAVNEDRRIISGPAMLADVPIFRKAEGSIPDHMVVFKAATIYEIAQKFFLKGFNQNFNLMHDENQIVEGVSVFESFIVDSTRGIQPMKGYEDASDGSWFMSATVKDDAVWEKIKSGEVKGFSVEGLFKYKKAALSSEEAFEKIKSILNEIIDIEATQ